MSIAPHLKSVLKLPENFAASAGKSSLPVTALSSGHFATWIKAQDKALRHRVTETGFAARAGQVLPLYGADGALCGIVVGVNDPVQTYDMAIACDYLLRTLSEQALKEKTFTLEGLKGDDLTQACIGWGIGGYRFEAYKQKKTTALPRLVWPKGADKKSALAFIEAMITVRSLINIPANDMGPDELEKVIRGFAKNEEMTIKVIRDEELRAQNFPLIYAVGQGSPRRPRLIDLKWGDPAHPKVTLIGKGVCFDTGGLDLKPSAAMYTMKKDMGGAAHVLALALLIMRHKLPVRLRVLIPAVENSVSGESFRPSDVIGSRKGLTVEIGNTDAEGRLILADALTWASEEKPDLMVDFATLTGGVAMGPEVPALLSNNQTLAFRIKDISEKVHDNLWPLPLIQNYKKFLASDIADINNNASARGGTIHAGLFLESFVDPKIDWVHIDLFAWETGGRIGRTKGGTEMGLHALYAAINDRYSGKKSAQAKTAAKAKAAPKKKTKKAK